MRLPRFSVAGLMLLVGIAAIDCVGVGMMLNGLELPTNEIICVRLGFSRSIHQQRQIAFAVVPMINILALVAVWGNRRPGRIGFLVAGSLAMVVVGWITAATIDWYSLRQRGYESWGEYLLIEWAGPYLAPIRTAVIATPELLQKPCGFVYMVLLVSSLPTIAQIGVGLLGWWFDRRYEIRRRLME